MSVFWAKAKATVLVVHQNCIQAPDPDRPPYKMISGQVSLVPGLNITYMNEQIEKSSNILAADNDTAVTPSVATA